MQGGAHSRQSGRRPLRVAVIGPPVATYYGGQEVQACNIVVNWNNDPLVTARFVSNRPNLRPLWSLLENLRYLRTVLRLPLYLSNLLRATRQADIFHVFAASYRSFLLATVPAFAIGRILRKKMVIHYHSGRADDHLRRSVLAQRILRSADLVVVPSAFLTEVFRGYDIPSSVIPNLVDPQRFLYRSRASLEPRLLCTRNFERHYGVDVVLRAFSLIQKQYPDSHLSLVGTGTMEHHLREIANDLHLTNVEFKGAILPSMMPDVYDRHDIFVNGSYADCSPVSILESFCCGLPVVTTAAGGIGTLVSHEKTGLLSAPNDHHALAGNVMRVLRQQEFARSLTEHARETVDAHSWHNLRKLWLDAYASVSQDT